MKFVAWVTFHLESREIVDDYLERVSDLLRSYDSAQDGGHELVICEDVDCVKREIADADVMIGWRITPEVFAAARKLKWIQFGSAGIDHTLFPELVASDVILTNLSGIHTVPVAEHVLALMLALSRRLDLSMKLQIERRYDRAEIARTAWELYGQTVGIVGLGKIGMNVARLAKAFGMRVVGTKKTILGEMENVDRVYPPSALHEMLPEVDFVVLAVPLTEGTKALMGRREIELLKHGACLVNVARGAMVDHDALADALRSGRMRGAALDVFPQEPLAQDSPIYDLPNVIITPHTAGSHARYGESAAAIFEHNLRAFLSSGEMINVYDRERQY